MINWLKVMEICDQSWNLTNFAPEFDQFVPFFLNLEKFSISLQSLHLPTFSTQCRGGKICAEMVMENQEMVIEKSWKIQGGKNAKSVGSLKVIIL